ncbi:mitochondrial ribosomal protein L21 [Lycorma delicatula]|uniref:mitochondrial ribosomal protein L21 n=1 Tax=Lycorma delicatula TaxID=130591 RepID=UPI003F51A2DE
MASLFLRNIDKNVCKSVLGVFSSAGINQVIKPLNCSVASRFLSNQNVMPEHQEIIKNNTEDDRLFTKETIALVNSQIEQKKEGRLFAVIHVAGKQFKITAEDIIIIHGHWPPQPSDEIQFEKVLMVAGQDFSLIGRPVLPSGLVCIKGTIIEKDLSHTKTRFVKQRRKQFQRINFIRSEHTMVRINEIKFTGKVGESKTSEPLGRTIQR